MDIARHTTLNDYISTFLSSRTCTPASIAGTGIGITMASGGALLFTYFGNGNLKQVAQISCAGYILGRFIWWVGECCRICNPYPNRTRMRQFLESINKVMKFVLLGSFPVYGILLAGGHPPLTLEKGALYLGGVITPFAALSTVLSIIKDFKNPPVRDVLEGKVIPQDLIIDQALTDHDLKALVT